MVAVISGTLPKWAKDSCYGYGCGHSYGSGYGQGQDDGSGYGSSEGPGSGYGDGEGQGYGAGSGYGQGYGYGSGYGYSPGNGAGSGYNLGPSKYWASCLQYFAAKLPEAQRARLVALEKAGARIAYWRSTRDGRAANNGSNAPVRPGTIETETGPLRDSCGKGQLHATLIPSKWKGERWWIVALIGEVRGDDDKMWALRREIIGECL